MKRSVECNRSGVQNDGLVTTSLLEITNLQVGAERLKASPSLVFQVSFDRDESCYSLEGDFEIFLYAFSRRELESALIELLQIMWRDYALEEDEAKLAPSGLKLKSDLLRRFSKE